jgi:hypothetical protein
MVTGRRRSTAGAAGGGGIVAQADRVIAARDKSRDRNIELSNDLVLLRECDPRTFLIQYHERFPAENRFPLFREAL